MMAPSQDPNSLETCMHPPVRLLFLSLTTSLVALLSGFASAAEENWFDAFYQYRMPVTLEISAGGWNSIPLTPAKITAEINRLEQLQYDPKWFAVNYVKVVEIDALGQPVAEIPSAGFYLVPDGPELVKNGSFEDVSDGVPIDWTDRSGKGIFRSGGDSHDGSQSLAIRSCEGSDSVISHRFPTLPNTPHAPLELGAYYLLSYWARVDTIGGCPAIRLISSRAHIRGWAEDMDNKYPISYVPRLWHKSWTKYEQVLKPYLHWNEGGAIRISGPLNGTAQVDNVSFRQMRLVFLAQVDRPGRHRWQIYYQPLNGEHITVPQRRHTKIPTAQASLVSVDRAQKHLGRTQYRVVSNDVVEVRFAETTVKISPQMLGPAVSSNLVRIACAKNEQQSFQLVIRPKKSVLFSGVEVTDLHSDYGEISESQVKVRALEFIPILRPSSYTPTNYSGRIADPMVEVEPKMLVPSDGNLPLWLTINVPRSTRAGVYRGQVVIKGRKKTLAEIPLELKVYDFELPEFASFRTLWGCDFMTKTFAPGTKTVADYHSLSSREDVRKLARTYYSYMAENKFYPWSVVMYSPIQMKWSPPPSGMGVDEPGNYFKLHDWDFTEFNKDLSYYIDDLKVNSFMLTMTNPSVCNLFTHLPGKELEDYDRNPVGHLTLYWQTWNEITPVGYEKRDWDWIEYENITQDQYDHLLLDFYRAMARNLEAHGWLDRAIIQVDETLDRGIPVYTHFLKLLKSDPLTARIKITWCLQDDKAYTHKASPDNDHYTFHGLHDIYLPQTDQKYNFFEKYYFTDYEITPGRDKLWNYTVHTDRAIIDTPGMTNRIAPLEVFHKGGGGYLRWHSFSWDSGGLASDNPWDDSGTNWGNGALSYFYPPSKYGPVSDPAWTIVPSLRIETYREGVDDFEYAKILEDLIAQGESRGVDVSQAKKVLAEIGRFFPSSVHWSQNDAWYLDLRDRMARTIVLTEKILGD